MSMRSLYESILDSDEKVVKDVNKNAKQHKFAHDLDHQRQVIVDSLVEIFGIGNRTKTGYHETTGDEFETNIPNNETRKVSNKLKEFVNKMNSFNYFTRIREVAGIRLGRNVKYQKWLVLDIPGANFQHIRICIFSYSGEPYLILGIMDSRLIYKDFDWNKLIKK